MFEQLAELVLERRGLFLESDAVAVALVAVPGGEQLAGDRESCLPEGFLFGMPSLWAVKSRMRWAQQSCRLVGSR